MIKVFCNKCGKEITGSVNVVTEKTDVIDCYNNTVATLTKMVHYCDECQYEDLTCGFKVGDQVITDDGRTGVIEDICDCDRCRDRGFYEPRVKMSIGNDQIWITDTDKKNGFINLYQIGDQVFGNVYEGAAERIKERIVELKHELAEYESQLNMLNSLN